LIPKSKAYLLIHSPTTLDALEVARQRLAFEELFIIQLTTEIIKQEWKKKKVGSMFVKSEKNEKKLQIFIDHLPFPLTTAQNNSILEIKNDLLLSYPMNRFLQGDVGSGKTVVAAAAMYYSYLNGFKSLYMAPTEILAQQHFDTISSLYKTYGLQVGLQTGNTKIKKNDFKKYDIIIGTQAVIQSGFEFDNVGLVVIDEQHRFGVAQRALLKEKGNNPHLLTMTATPIPRTVALTLYGDLNLSILDEMPAGRIPIKTYLVPKAKRQDSYAWIIKNSKEHASQTFIICPLIEESSNETMKSVKAASKEFEFLQKNVFKDLSVGLLHGKMKPVEKQNIMDQFKEKKIDILVSTSVVEVGIDIPDATIIIIEAAERFGLAQLHQLRGRVGRSSNQSYCLLFTEMDDEKTLERLKFFAKTGNGMELAEFDLKRRGAGNIFGTQQHGYSDLQIARFSDYDLIAKTKKAAQHFLEDDSIDKYPSIKSSIEKFNTKRIARD
jgi:ATP-dependent DNA helicase RecG